MANYTLNLQATEKSSQRHPGCNRLNIGFDPQTPFRHVYPLYFHQQDRIKVNAKFFQNPRPESATLYVLFDALPGDPIKIHTPFDQTDTERLRVGVQGYYDQESEWWLFESYILKKGGSLFSFKTVLATPGTEPGSKPNLWVTDPEMNVDPATVTPTTGT